MSSPLIAQRLKAISISFESFRKSVLLKCEWKKNIYYLGYMGHCNIVTLYSVKTYWKHAADAWAFFRISLFPKLWCAGKRLKDWDKSPFSLFAQCSSLVGKRRGMGRIGKLIRKGRIEGGVGNQLFSYLVAKDNESNSRVLRITSAYMYTDG